MKLIHIGMILTFGTGLFFYSEKWVMVPVTLGILMLYIWISFRKIYRRFKITKDPISSELSHFLMEHCAIYQKLGQKEKKRFDMDMGIILEEIPIVGLRGTEVTEPIRWMIVAGIALMLQGWPEWEPPLGDGVVVYPGDTFDEDYNIDEGNIAGSARQNSPLLVTEEMLKQGFSNHSDGYNPLIHELAHYFDFENPAQSGMPLIGNDPEKIAQWQQVTGREKEKVLQGTSFLRPYAGTNEAEFFAVATECFFERPDIMIQHNEELYSLLRDFYNLDTFEILSRPLMC